MASKISMTVEVERLFQLSGMPDMNQPLDDLRYLQQAKAHADEGVIGNVAAVCILGIAEAATLRCRRMAQTIYLHCSVDEIRKSLPEADADYVIARQGGSVDFEPLI